jgi:Tfp pilus assembly protein PilF
MSLQPPARRTGERSPDALIAWALALAAFVLYLPSLSNDFVDYDDPQYIHEAGPVRSGLTWQGVKWAFTTDRFLNWLPVTWLSHMLDVQLYGLNAGGHHATSAVLHAANAAMLFGALRAMTGRRGASAAVAALFAAHPLRVESVVWVAERKDVLCATFFMLALLAYARYCRRPSALTYALVLLCHALGLMSKTMLVTLPGVLLLLDYWPLRRTPLLPAAEGDVAPPFPQRSPGVLLLEKVPLVALSLVASLWTVVLQSRGAMTALEDLTLAQRAANAAVSVPRYLLKLAYPAGLSPFYPHPGSWPPWMVAASAALVVALSTWAVAQARRRPYVFVGWFWFVGMLVPVSGLMQVGLQSMADRYMYLPSIGLTVAVVWGVAEAVRARPQWRLVAGAATAVLVAALSVATWVQQRHWADTLSLFEHALAVDPDNWLAHGMVGLVYSGRGDEAGAIRHYQRATQINPHHPDAFNNYGVSLDNLRRYDEAIERFKQALRLQRPPSPRTRFALGLSLAEVGRLHEAADQFAKAAEAAPANPDVWVAWGLALQRLGRPDEAAARFREGLRLSPEHRGALAGLRQLSNPPATAPTTTTATTAPTAPTTAPTAPTTAPAAPAR